jgi:hypothetical protein
MRKNIKISKYKNNKGFIIIDNNSDALILRQQSILN